MTSEPKPIDPNGDMDEVGPRLFIAALFLAGRQLGGYQDGQECDALEEADRLIAAENARRTGERKVTT